MALLNLAWQGIGIMRGETIYHEKTLKNCSSLDIRTAAEKNPELKIDRISAGTKNSDV